MNTISSSMIGQMMAMDGRSYFSTVCNLNNGQNAARVPQSEPLTADSEQVVQNITNDIAQTKRDVQELQRLSDTMGHKLQFNVNDELGKVVIKIVDPRTDEVLKEIPSREIQNLQARMKQTMSILFDEMI